ncbi:hypothetical protein OIN59_03010 [Acidovorax sp. D2M1]|uniref:Uncharacterized protein n=1 Tax=Acidovorax benzenivorans TaxID=2987520 RepID=A0ABT5RRQ0_9BURK|nr:hypothetical protein [Acidovorax benzenivorans]MDD2176386.1 hypothetical protein [Acidovorax benzenivorans]
MYLLKFLFTALACLSFTLAAYCFAHIPLIKKSTEGAVEFLEQRQIDTTRLGELDKEMVNEALRTIRYNSRVLSNAHAKIWWASVCGFLMIGFISLAMVWTAVKKGRVADALAMAVPVPHTHSDIRE